MSKISVLIVDDEAAGRRALAQAIAQFDELTVVAEADDGQTAVDLVRQYQPDIVFLDIEMPEMDGFGVAKAIKELTHHLVFVTAFEQYALDAFGTKAVDYLLKPVRPQRVQQCIEKILLLQRQHSANIPATDNTMVIDDGMKKHLVANDHISYVESVRRYQRVHLTITGQQMHQSQTLIADITMDQFETRLGSGFYRLHRKFLVCLKQIKNLQMRDKQWHVCMKDDNACLPIARGKTTELKLLL